MLAIQTVHTTGINVASLAVILGGFAAVVGVLLTFVTYRQNQRDRMHDREQTNRAKEMQDLRADMTASVNHLGEILLAKLETKESVAVINSRLSKLEGVIERTHASE